MTFSNLYPLWESHHQTNKAQLKTEIFEQLQSVHKAFHEELWNQDFPKKSEYWKTANFSNLEKRKFHLSAPKTLGNNVYYKNSNHLVIEINDYSQGAHWNLKDTPEVMSLSDSLSHTAFQKTWFSRLSQQPSSGFFSKLNRAFLYSGLIITPSPGQQLNIEIKGNLSGTENDFLPFHLIFDVPSQAQIQVEETLAGSDFSGFLLYDKIFRLEKDSSLKYYLNEIGSKDSHILQNIEAHTSNGAARFTHFDVTLPSAWSRHNLTSQMNHSGSETHITGLYINKDNFFTDHHTHVVHGAPHTQSYQYYKGLLDDRAKAVYNGVVHIAEGAKQSSSEQLNKNLLLSKKAEVNTKPELRIDNDDVKAAHGATVGQLDPEQLFYLQSRGMSYHQAWRTLCSAFVAELFENWQDDFFDFEKLQIEDVLPTPNARDL